MTNTFKAEWVIKKSMSAEIIVLTLAAFKANSWSQAVRESLAQETRLKWNACLFISGLQTFART